MLLTSLWLWKIYTGWPRNNATPTINNFKETYALLHIKFFFQQDNAKMINFDEGVFLRQCYMYIQNVSLLSQKSQLTYRKFSIVWLPRVKCLLLLCRTKTVWIKRSIATWFCSVIIQGSYSEKFLRTSIVTFDSIEANFENDIAWEKWLYRIKRLHQNQWSWCNSAGKRIFYALMHSIIWFSPWFLWK